jgi:hypothetical protein
MITQRATVSHVSPFPAMLVFPDVDPQVLMRDEGTCLDARKMLDGAWVKYMRRVLPPVGEQVAKC